MKTDVLKKTDKQIIRETRAKIQEKLMSERKKGRDKIKAEAQKKKKTDSLPKLKDRLWLVCRSVIRKRYMTKTGSAYCYTCGAWLTEGKQMHTAHMIPEMECCKVMVHDLRNLRICCNRCNVHAGGNGAKFYRNMVAIEGQEYVDGIFQDNEKFKHSEVDADWYRSKIKEYSEF